MSLKINFFPLHFIISILVLITCTIVFSDIVYVYMSSNIYINGLIISLFIFCMIWLLGVLSYYSRSAKVINKLFGMSTEAETNANNASVYVASTIAGTLIDNPIASRVLSSFARTGKIDVSYSDAMTIVEAVENNGDRVLGPSRFLASLFTMLGLFGTFVGLLETIDGVGNALAGLSDSDSVDIFGLVGLLADPLNGMSVAFSASLFGLIAALYGNYGNYVASQQLAVFVNKLKNFLTATTGVSVVDPAEIKAEDILLALEDSFNKLSVTFSEKLDVVSEGLFAMSKVIARGQDRQEKLSKAMLINLVKLVELSDKLSLLEDFVDGVAEVIEENRIEFFKYLDQNIVERLELMLTSAELSNRIATDHVAVAEKSNVVVEDLAGMAEDLIGLTEAANSIMIEKAGMIDSTLKANGEILSDVLDSSDEALPILESIDSKTTGIDYRPSFDSVVDTIIENNELASELNSLSDEANNLADTLINKVATEDSLNATIGAVENVNSAIDDAIGELELHREIFDKTLDTINDIADENNSNLTKVIELNDQILAEVRDANPLYQSILDEAVKSNDLSNDSIDELVKTNELLNEQIVVANDSLGALTVSNETLSSMKETAEASNDSLAEINNNLLSEIDLVEKLVDSSEKGLDEMYFLRDTMEIFKDNMSLSNDYLSKAISVYDESLNKLTSIDSILSEQLGLTYNLEKYADALLTNTEQVLGLSESLNNKVEDITNGFSMFLPLMTEVMGLVRDEMTSLNDVVTILGNNIYDLSQELLSNSESIDRFGEIVSVLDMRMENLDNSSSVLNSTIQQLLPVMYETIELSANNSQYLSQLIGTLDYIAQTAEGIGQSMSDFANTVLQENAYISEQVSIVSETVMDSTDRIIQALSETSSVIMDASNQMAEAANQSTDVANNNAMAAEAMLSVVSEFSQLRDMYSGQMTEVSQLLSETIASVLETTDYVSSNLVDFNSLINQIENYSYDVMSTQENIREAIQGMLSVNEHMANSQNDFLNALNSSVDYTASMFTDGMNSVIERLDNVNMLTEVQTGKLDNLDYRLSELPETVSTMFMSLGNLVEGMQNVVYEIMSQNSQAQMAIMEAVSDNKDANAMVMNMVDQTESLHSMISGLVSQSEYANNIVDNISSQTQAMQGSVDMLSNNFAGVYDSLMNTSNNISGVADSLFTLSGEMSTQVDALERNSAIAINLSNDLQSLAFSNESLRNVGESLNYIINSFENVSLALAGVQASSENMDRTFANYSDILFGEMTRLTQTLSSHLEMFMSKDFALGQDMFSIMNNVLLAVNDISHAINTFENFASDSMLSNREVKQQLDNSMSYAIAEIASIKENLGHNISERVIAGISQVSQNQSEMINRLDYVMPQINNLIDMLSSNSGGFNQGGMSQDSAESIISALMSLREEHQNGNARLDIMANAVDTLITEILNSRDVAETILDVVTKMAGLTRN